MSAEKAPSLANLPGQEADSAARDRRKQLRDLDLSQKELEEMLLPATIDLEGAERTAESYALSSFVIEALWEHIQEQAAHSPVTLESPPGLEGESVSKRFVGAMSAQLNTYRDSFVEGVKASLKSDAEPTKEDLLTIRYMKLMVESTGKIGVPSMQDLVTIVGRVADVVPKVYARDLQKQASEEDVFRAIAHPSLKRLCMEMMSNSRPLLAVVFDRMESDPSKNLDDPTGEFDPSFFEVAIADNGSEYVRFRPAVIQSMRDTFEKVAIMRAESGKELPKTLVCPALYTGKFVEMYDWVEAEYEAFCRREAGAIPGRV